MPHLRPTRLGRFEQFQKNVFESFQAPARNAYNGLVLAIVRAKSGQPGTITLKATADGLAGASTKIRSD